MTRRAILQRTEGCAAMTVINSHSQQCPHCGWYVYMTSEHPAELAHYARHIARCEQNTETKR